VKRDAKRGVKRDAKRGVKTDVKIVVKIDVKEEDTAVTDIEGTTGLAAIRTATPTANRRFASRA